MQLQVKINIIKKGYREMRRKMNKWFCWTGSLVLFGLGLGYKQTLTEWTSQVQEIVAKHTVENFQPTRLPEQKQKTAQVSEKMPLYDQQQYHQLSNKDFQSGDRAVLEVNNGKSTLDISQWQENKVIYGDLDSLNRTTVVTAFLDKKI